MKFSVVTVNYDSWPYTLQCIRSLYETGYEDFEIIVVDNDPRSIPPELSPPVRLIQNPENLGFSRACNVGIAASKGELVVLINPDTFVGAMLLGVNGVCIISHGSTRSTAMRNAIGVAAEMVQADVVGHLGAAVAPAG